MHNVQVKMSNKNKQGIESFLKTQKLFNKGSHRFSQTQNRMYNTSNISNGRGTASKGYHHYNLLNFKTGEGQAEQGQAVEIVQMRIDGDDVRRNNLSEGKVNKGQANIVVENKNNPESKLSSDQQNNIKPTTSIKRQGAQQSQSSKQKDIIYEPVYAPSHSHSPSLLTQMKPIPSLSSTSLQKRRALTRQPSPVPPPSSQQPMLPIQQQHSPISWQTLVTKSSLRYFQSCRTQALQYTQKLKSTLLNDRSHLHASFNTIQTQIQNMHVQMFETVKQNLYQMVDAAVDIWRRESLEAFNKKQLNYLAQLYELNTQVEERIKQIQKIEGELDSEREWKIRASDLLTANYQADLLQLSRMVRRSTISAEQNVQLYWSRVDRDLKGKFGNRDHCKQLSTKMYAVISEGYPNYQNPIKPTIISPQLQTPNKVSLNSKQPPTTSTQQKTPQPTTITTSNYSFFNQQPSYLNSNQTMLNSGNNNNRSSGREDAAMKRIYTFNEEQHNKEKERIQSNYSKDDSREANDNKQNTSRTRDNYDGSSDKV